MHLVILRSCCEGVFSEMMELSGMITKRMKYIREIINN